MRNANEQESERYKGGGDYRKLSGHVGYPMRLARKNPLSSPHSTILEPASAPAQAFRHLSRMRRS